MKKFEDFTNLFPLSKTLRFELKPIGATAHNIQRDGILKEDSHRAESYLRIKKIIDCYHKRFIDRALSSLSLNIEDLKRFTQLYNEQNRSDLEKVDIENLQTSLRKQIVKKLTSSDSYKTIH